MNQVGISEHDYRRVQKLAWPFSKERIHQTIPPLWWKYGLPLDECSSHEGDTLPVAAVIYAMGRSPDREDLFRLMPTVPPEAVLMAYGHAIVHLYMHHASFTGNYFGGARPNRDLLEDLHWVLSRLEKLGYPSHGLSDVDIARYFGNINSVHCRFLPTGLLRLRQLAGHFGWPEAVERELVKRQDLAYRLWAGLRVRAYALTRTWY